MKIFSGESGFFSRALAAALACAALSPAAAADWKFSSSLNYSAGKYGTAERTTSLYVPFTLKRYYARYDLAVTVPYLRQTSAGQMVWVGGKPLRATRGSFRQASTTEAGPGDIVLRATRGLTLEDAAFGLALAGKLKLPTADEDKGLGTGQADIGAGLEFSKEVSAGWTLLVDGYYTVIGEPAGVNFNDQLALDLGFTRTLRENLALTVLYETQNAIVEGNPGPRGLSAALTGGAAGGLQVSGGLGLGLSDGSPDLGLSAGFSLKF